MTWEKWERDCRAMAIRDGMTDAELDRMLSMHLDRPKPLKEKTVTALEKVARAIWLARELNQAERCRMRWEEGTPLARQTAAGLAHAAVLALLNPMNVSLLEDDGTPRHFDDVLASILSEEA